MKVVHLPTSVGGMSWGLAQGEKALGISSEVLVSQENWLYFPADRVILKNTPRSIIGRTSAFIKLVTELYQIRKAYDVFHFNFGTSLIDLWRLGLPLVDLPFYKGKIVVTYNGCDARQKHPTIQRVPFSACHQDDCYNGICNDELRDRIKKRKVEKFDQYADAIFAVNPDLLYFLPGRARFLPYAISNWSQIERCPYEEFHGRLKIIHCPTNRGAKGSETIIEAVNRLKHRYGSRIEFRLIENLPNRKAREIYAEANLAIDQILIGWYGGFAVEVMKMGKPVMAFIRKEDLKFLPDRMALECEEAVINVNPQSLYERLCYIVENPEVLRRYREASLEYVYRWHDPVSVANITKSVYERLMENREGA